MTNFMLFSSMLYLLITEHTFRTVALGCMLLGITSGILGCFAVLRRQSLLGDAISHASLSGICIMYLLTNSKNTGLLLLGALTTGIVCIIIINIIQNFTKVKLDSILAFLLSVFFGLGLVLLSYLNKLPGANKAGLNKFIFGQASTLTQKDINLIFFVGLVLLFVVILFWKEFKIVSFDLEFANTLGYPSSIINMIISILIVTIVIVGIQAVGIILVTAMLISPAVAARQWSDKLYINAILSGIIGGFSGLLGTMISMNEENIPTGPIIVLIVSIIVVFSVLFSPKRGIVYKIWKNNKEKKKIKRILQENINLKLEKEYENEF